jgi:hypothetical protein
MPSSFCLPPVECSPGTSPVQAANSRPLRNAAPLPMAATTAVAVTGPMPGIFTSRWQASFSCTVCPISTWVWRGFANPCRRAPFCYRANTDGRQRWESDTDSRWWVPEHCFIRPTTTIPRRTIPLVMRMLVAGQEVHHRRQTPSRSHSERCCGLCRSSISCSADRSMICPSSAPNTIRLSLDVEVQNLLFWAGALGPRNLGQRFDFIRKRSGAPGVVF